MKTKIALIHLHVPLEPEESFRSVVSYLVEAWALMYRRSGTGMSPVLLHDDKSIIPKCWPFEIAKLAAEEPPQAVPLLDRISWLKSQLHSQLGRCLVVDWDCLFLKNLDHLDDLDAPMAMPRHRQGYRSGLILMNSPEILQHFRDGWERHGAGAMAYANERLGTGLGWEYDCSWEEKPEYSDTYDPEIESVARQGAAIHFEGRRKEMIWEFLARRGITW